MSLNLTMLAGLVAGTLGLAAMGAQALDARHGDLQIEHPWSRATPAGAPVAGGYLVVRNHGSEADRLVGGEAAFAGRVEIHEMAMQDGVMRMRALPDGLEIPAGGQVELQPGGYHVMFMQLREPLAEGELRPVTLVFEQAGPIEVPFRIEAMGATRSHRH